MIYNTMNWRAAWKNWVTSRFAVLVKRVWSFAHETSIYIVHFSSTNDKFMSADACWFPDDDYQVFMYKLFKY